MYSELYLAGIVSYFSTYLYDDVDIGDVELLWDQEWDNERDWKVSIEWKF